ncbi:hypothetical protein BJQ94_09970 [Cryobacterium sp. SO2]|uniref:hypothetical protein n=1 Tax=Cryobacterium sp. SO2 TaxID=1897060 RepID=UPI00223DE9FB|nr:hypothetical protein [Cryobacterium sp. SO2]WEO75724.1 hypothetical protein BJQ94_09970 [Cryobacterium sp. SO2]
MVPDNLLIPTDDDFDRFEERLLHTLEAQRVQRRSRHRAVAATATALLLAGVGGTAWITLATPELRSLSAYCYAEASTDSTFTQVGSPTDQIDGDGTVTPLAPVVDPAAAAVENCASVWAIDFFGTGTSGLSTVPSGGGETPAPASPDLQACLRPDGVYAVFPVGSDNVNAGDPDAFCAAVGLQPPFTP